MRLLCFLVFIAHCALPAQETRAVEALTASFRQQKAEAECDQLALYADQLTQLQQQLAAKGDEAAASQAASELKSTQAKLQTLQAALIPKPAKTNDASDGAAIFADEDEEAAISYGKQKRLPIVRLPLREATALPAGKLQRDHWLQPDAAARWTVHDTPPGKYHIRAVYRALKGESGGRGQLLIAGSSTPIPFTITPTKGNWKDLNQQDIATLDLVKCPIDLTIRSAGLTHADAPLFDLIALWLVPENASASKPAADPKKKIDF